MGPRSGFPDPWINMSWGLEAMREGIQKASGCVSSQRPGSDGAPRTGSTSPEIQKPVPFNEGV